MWPYLCRRAQDAPRYTDVLLTFDAAATIAVESEHLAATSGYFRALLSWPSTAAAATTSTTTGDVGASASAAAACSSEDRPAARSTAASDDIGTGTGTGTGNSSGDASGSNDDASGCDDDASESADDDAGASGDDTRSDDAAAELRVVPMPGTDPNAALLALRALYDLPWAGCLHELLDVHELLDAWDACAPARARCTEMLRRSATADRYARTTTCELAWGLLPRALSDALRDELLALAARRPDFDCGWERVRAAVAAAFLARHDLAATEDEVLGAALRWVRAAPRPDDDVAAVSRAVRYGALPSWRLAKLWAEPRMPAAMLMDAGRLTAQARGRGLYNADPVSVEVVVRCMRRTPTAPFTADSAERLWRVRCAQCADHEECFLLALPLTDLRALLGGATRRLSPTVRCASLTFECKLRCRSEEDDYEWVLLITDAERDCHVVCTAASARWTWAVEEGCSQKCLMPLGKEADLLGRMPLRDVAGADAGAAEADLPTFAIHIMHT